MVSKWGGIWPAVATAFKPDGEPNLQAMDQMVELFVQQQLGGLYLLGSTGQGPAIGLEDRKRIAAHVIQTTAGRLPVMVHVGAVATRDAIELARHAEQCGADAVSSVPPIYFPADVDAIFEHYRLIGQATSLPFFPYHASFLQSVLPAGREYAQRVLEIPNIAGMKITDMNFYLFSLIRHYTNNQLALFSGADELMCAGMLSGSVGAIGTFYNIFGPTYKHVREAFDQGDIESGRKLTAAFAAMLDEVRSVKGGIWSFIRRAMYLKYGIELGQGITAMHLIEGPWKDKDVQRLISLVDDVAPVAQAGSVDA